MTVGVGETATVATSPRRTGWPLGVWTSMSFIRSTLVRVCGPPHTTTSKIACCSYRLPTVRPEISALASRRTSPGRSPYRCAAARSTCTDTVGWVTSGSTSGEMTPSTVFSACRTSSAVAWSVA